MSNAQKGLSPHFYDSFIQELQLEKANLLKNKLYSDDAEEILKAQAYLANSMRNTKQSNPQAYFFAPDWTNTSGKPYKDQRSSVPDNVLRKVSHVHIIDLIIQTKINQVQNYLKFVVDEQQIGYTIRKKLSRFEDKTKKTRTKAEEKEIERIAFL